METTVEDLPAAEQALQAFDDALTDLVATLDGDELSRVGDDRLLDFMAGFERVRNRMAVVDHEIVHACEETELPERLQLRSPANVLAQVVRVHEGEACRRVKLAEALRPQQSMLGEPLPAERPELGTAVAAGMVTPEQAALSVKCLQHLDGLFWTDAQVISDAEHTLTEAAQEFGFRDFRRVVDRVADAIDPDGVLNDDRIQEAHRQIELVRGRDGVYRLRGRLTPELANKITAVTDPLSAPQHGVEGRDQRTPAQRRHDAFEDAFDRLLRSGDLPATGGTAATVVVTIDVESLVELTAFGRLVDGSPIAPETLLKLAGEAEILPVVLTASGEVLSLGRSRRIADKNQTAALIARDGGCSFPGCDRAPAWCERHHIISWLDGGLTDIDNLTLLCRYHHRHFERNGWTCRMVDGVPTWIPPRWVDPEQEPLINYRIQERRDRARTSALTRRTRGRAGKQRGQPLLV